MAGQSRKFKLTIYLFLNDSEEAEAVFRALEPELRGPLDRKRGDIKISCRDNEVKITIIARDLGSLRALLNAYTYLLETIRKVVTTEI